MDMTIHIHLPCLVTKHYIEQDFLLVLCVSVPFTELHMYCIAFEVVNSSSSTPICVKHLRGRSPRDYAILLSAYMKAPPGGVLLVACILDTRDSC